MTESLRPSGHAPDIEGLSALIDERLPAVELARLQGHLRECDACRGVLDELRQVRTALVAMPEVQHPRSFRLRQADVESRRRPVGTGWSWSRLAPALSGVAAVVFVVVVSADALSRDNDAASDSAVQMSRDVTGAIAQDDAASIEAGAPAPDAASGGVAPPDTGTAIAGPESDEGQDPRLGGVAPTPADAFEADSAITATALAPLPFATSMLGAAVTATQVILGAEPRSSDPTTVTPSDDGPMTAAPTGAPPDGDTEIPATRDGAEGEAGATAATPPEGVAQPPDAPALPETTASLEQAAVQDDGSGGNFDWLLFVEVAAAAVAIAAGAFWLARRFAGGGANS